MANNSVNLSAYSNLPDPDKITGTWPLVKCTGEITNAAVPVETRWAEADADNAFAYANWVFQNDKQNSQIGDLPYVQAISNVFNGEQNMDCAIDGGICQAPALCNQTENPAAWLILESFSNMNVFFTKLYGAMKDAETPMIGEIGTFTSTFAPGQQTSSFVINTILDVFNLAFGLFAAGIWNSVGNALTAATRWGSTIQWASASSAILSGATAFTKDNLPSAESGLTQQNDLSTVVDQMIQGYMSSFSSYVSSLMTGAANDTTLLASAFARGAWLAPELTGPTQSLYNAQLSMENAFYALLIPQVWNLTGTGYPTIIAQNGTCNPNSPWATDSLPPISEEDAAKVRVCNIIGAENLTFYLIATPDCEKAAKHKRSLDLPERGIDVPGPAPPPQNAVCQSARAQMLPGIAELDGKQWGGVTVRDIVASAYVGYLLNGHRNGYVMPPPDKATLLDGSGKSGATISPNGISTPGVITVPVCAGGAMDAATNWEKFGGVVFNPPGGKPPFYPCEE